MRLARLKTPHPTLAIVPAGRTMKTVAFLLLILSAPTAAADEFDRRVARATAAVETRAGHAYDMALVPAIHAITTRCVPAGRARPQASANFVAVASVDPAGRVRDVRVRPATPLAQCFARHLGSTRLQPPPTPATGTHPIVIRIRDRF
jgi:hypothetical protein